MHSVGTFLLYPEHTHTIILSNSEKLISARHYSSLGCKNNDMLPNFVTLGEVVWPNYEQIV